MHSHSERKEREKLVCITLTLVESLPNKNESDRCYHLYEENKRCDKLNKKRLCEERSDAANSQLNPYSKNTTA